MPKLILIVICCSIVVGTGCHYEGSNPSVTIETRETRMKELPSCDAFKEEAFRVMAVNETTFIWDSVTCYKNKCHRSVSYTVTGNGTKTDRDCREPEYPLLLPAPELPTDENGHELPDPDQGILYE